MAGFPAYEHENFNSHTPCGVRPGFPYIMVIDTYISTHTPHVGCDPAVSYCHSINIFQLTHPMWGATRNRVLFIVHRQISTHTPHVGCDPIFCEKIRTALYMLGWTYEILLFKIKIYANYAANLSQYSYYYRFA